MPSSGSAGLTELLTHAQHIFKTTESESGLGFAEEVLRDLWQLIHDRIADLKGGPMLDAGVDLYEAIPGDRVALASSLPSLVSEPLLQAGAATVGVVTILVTIAVAAAASANYFPKQTFGTGEDYLALFISGFGSSILASILAAVLLWQRNPKA